MVVEERTLVLGGGGVTGVAWELGVLAGLAEVGLDPAAAETVIGTSAGSVVGALLRSGSALEELYAGQLTDASGEVADRVTGAVVARLGWAALRGRDPVRARVRIGRMALSASTMPEPRRRAVIAARLGADRWPVAPLRVTAVDAVSGEFVVFDRDSGVSLVDAVGASCAVPGVWPPVTIGERRYIDGGMRSPVNADLARGARRVLVLAPVTRGLGPIGRLRDQVTALRGAGARVVVVSPDGGARRAIGRNVLDPARRAAAARAGRVHAVAVRDEVAAVWGG